jgi:hypothetical protein
MGSYVQPSGIYQNAIQTSISECPKAKFHLRPCYVPSIGPEEPNTLIRLPRSA